MTKETKSAAGPRRRRSGKGARGVLWLLAGAFLLSGLLRIGGETGVAIANGFAAAVDARTGTGPIDCPPPPDIAEVLALLAEREARIAAREAAMADRQQALVVAEARIADSLAALESAETSLEATMALASSAAENDLAQLTSVYENMKPKDAIPLFAAMAPEFAAGFLARMRSDSAAAILAGLDPETAYSISVLLAGRNSKAPTQ